MGTKKYLDAEGKPVPLSYLGKNSFTSLAEGISNDIRARAMLDEFIRMDIVSHDKINNTVTLKAESFVPHDGWEDKLYYLGSTAEITSPLP